MFLNFLLNLPKFVPKNTTQTAMSGGGEIPNIPTIGKVAIDSSEHFFLHALDQHGAILVTKPLNGTITRLGTYR